MNKELTYIVGSAIKTKDLIVTGLRHSDCYRVIAAIYKDLDNMPSGEQQGFLTNKMEFVSRSEALKIILNNDQVTRTDRARLKLQTTMLSEDLW